MVHEKEKNTLNTKRYAGYIQLTRNCNRKCIFCSNPNVNDTLSFSDAIQKIDNYIKNGINEIIFTGGEPTLNDDIFRIMRYCKNKGIEFRIITNGDKLADENYAKRIASVGLKNINISIYSHKKNIQDKLTETEESYEKTLLAIKNTLRYICIPNINITINKSNAENLDETVKFIFRKFPMIKHFSFNNLDPIGRAIKNKWIIPRLFDSELSLYKTLHFLSLKNKTFRVERIPLCYMQGFEEFSTETRKIVKKEIYGAFFLNKNGRVTRNFKNFYYKKDTCCKICNLNEICAGLNPRYAHFFGTEELFPSFQNKCEIICKVKKGE